MNRSDLLKNFSDFLKDCSYSNLTQTAYLSDINQFIDFILIYKNNLDFIDKLTKKDFKEYIDHLREKHISPHALSRKYFAIKSFASFLEKNYHINFISKIYTPNLLKKSEKNNLCKIMLEIKESNNETLTFNFIIFYLSNIFKLTHKKIVTLTKKDIKIFYNSILILNKKYNCNKDFSIILKNYLNNFKSSESKLFNISFQASTVISRNFLTNNDNNLEISSESSFNNIIIDKYKKIHPRS